ncbi:hypothetical protein MNBD_GAMMA25-770 [hydrothermal vent metagenome]|uniref:Response regulatory domain-containing protein n=1 Tax=hydrothermal vent metagenome TaxID=652676 RepID=A0A3B1AMA2_9ZZZZ
MTTNQPQGEKSILLIDDEVNVLAALQRLLHPLPYNIITANSGQQALEVVRAQPLDLIFLDVRMPEMDGFEYLQILREQNLTQAPVVMLTAEDEVMKGYMTGAAYYITKPFENEYVINIIEYLIGDPSEERKAWLELRI